MFTHRRTDAEFRDLYWVALEQAVGKLLALRIQREIERAEGRLEPEIEARMDGPPDARQVADLVKLMAALRDLTRNLGGGERPGKAAAPHAGLDEVCSALAKRLKAFPPTPETSEGRSAGGLPSPSYPADAGRAPPSPLQGEGESEASDER